MIMIISFMIVVSIFKVTLSGWSPFFQLRAFIDSDLLAHIYSNADQVNGQVALVNCRSDCLTVFYTPHFWPLIVQPATQTTPISLLTAFVMLYLYFHLFFLLFYYFYFSTTHRMLHAF